MMIETCKRTLQFVAIGAILACLGHAAEPGALDSLVDASAQRLEIARQVALAKWDSGAPVEDVTRERHVIEAATQAGVKAGLPSELVTRFFSAQIEANKLIQYVLLATWQQQKNAPPHKPVDLARDVRPQIDRIQASLISGLAGRPEESRVSCRAQVADAIEHHKVRRPGIPQCLFSTALERALAPLCDSMR